jgi:methionine-rich copper-binding protein CopC
MDDMGRRTVIGALATLILALSASAAFAHCFLDHSMPPSASVMTSSPSRVVLYFDNQFNPDASTVRVLSENGDVVSGSATASSDDRALIVPLRPLSAGQYFVKWRATSPDGDHTTGAYSFTVKAAP